jgi:flavin reductase (DIM6/NTAB) family NADH-FMN oxidoreductase RutF
MSIDTREFRSAVGCFPTGVAVVTTLMPGKAPVGVTVNSFTSVSLDPPMVLWCLNRKSERFDIFANSDLFAICLLCKSHEAVSSRLAKQGAHSLDGIELVPTQLGPPALANALAVFECQKEAVYEGGDHVILLGRVIRFGRPYVGEPLVFHNGRYNGLAKTA